MKKLLLMTGVILMLFGCQKVQEDEQIIDKWNGYGNFFKNGAVTIPLIAGQTDSVGTITYQFDEEADNPVFRVTYNTTGDWVMTETHMYAGLETSFLDVTNKYVNKQLTPRIGLFPYSSNHNPGVTEKIYEIPLTALPGYADGGYILATHAVVTRPGQTETAWGDWDETFNDKRWGGYITDLYQEDVAPINPIAYGIGVDPETGEFILTMTDLMSGGSNIISIEPAVDMTFDGVAMMSVDNSPQLIYTATSSDNESNYTYELVVNDLTGVIDTYVVGTLDSSVESAVVHNGDYYYLSGNTINKIDLTINDGLVEIANEVQVPAIPIEGYTAHDMTVTPEGLVYIIGTNADGNLQLISLDLANNNTYNTDFPTLVSDELSIDTQLVYTDGELYTITTSPTDNLLISNLDPQSSSPTTDNDSEIPGGGGVIDIIGGRGF